MEESIRKLDSILNAIDSKSEVKQSEKSIDETTKLLAFQNPVWFKYFDITSNKFYYHNPTTNTTQWDIPVDFVDIPVEPISTPAEYTSSVAFCPTKSSVTVGASSYWEKVGRATDREGRQLGAFFDVNSLTENRLEAKRKQKEIREMGIDWKQYKQEKQAKKRSKAADWLRKDD